MSTPFSISSQTTANADYIRLHGNIDAAAEQQLKNLPAIVKSPVVRLDFSSAGRINSMGIALLLRCLKSIREQQGSQIYLRELNPTNAVLFKMTGVFMLASHEK